MWRLESIRQVMFNVSGSPSRSRYVYQVELTLDDILLPSEAFESLKRQIGGLYDVYYDRSRKQEETDFLNAKERNACFSARYYMTSKGSGAILLIKQDQFDLERLTARLAAADQAQD